MTSLREYLSTLGSIASLFIYAAVAGGVVGTFWLFASTIAGMAPR